MTVVVGERIPEVWLRRVGAGGAIEKVSTAELFGGRRSVLFGVPGAFTPTCSREHLPGYVARARELAGAGVDLVACVAVNDPFVMDAWGRSQNVGDSIAMLSDADGELARALGLEVDLSGIGLGRRCRRFGAVLEDGLFTHIAVEPARGVTVCGADHLLAALEGTTKAGA